MIPTIQLVYGTMPKIKKLGPFLQLEYDSEFYIFERIANVSNHCLHFIIDGFLKETFNCLEAIIAKHRYLNMITIYNLDSSKVINTLITDDFYDSFQVLLSNLKTQ